MAAQRVGMVGLGKMGGPMALHLHERGMLAAIYSPRTAKTFAAKHGLGDAVRLAASPKDAARATASVLVSVPLSAVDGVLFGPEGVANGVTDGVVIEAGNSDHRQDPSYESRFAAKGVGYLDAAVSGGPKRARAGDLVSIVGGRDDAFEEVRPVFEAFSGRDSIFHVGPCGRGHEAKMYHNQDEQNDMRNIGEALSLLMAAGRSFPDGFSTLDRGVCRSALLTYAGTIPSDVLPHIAPEVGGGDLPTIAVATADAVAHPTPLTRLTLNLRRLSRRELTPEDAATRAASDSRATNREGVVRFYNFLRQAVNLDAVPGEDEGATIARALALGYLVDLAEVMSLAHRRGINLRTLARIFRAGLCDKVALDPLIKSGLPPLDEFSPTLTGEDREALLAILALGERLGHPTPSAAAYLDFGGGDRVVRELRKLSDPHMRTRYDNALRIQAGIRDAFGEHGYRTEEVTA